MLGREFFLHLLLHHPQEVCPQGYNPGKGWRVPEVIQFMGF